MSEIDRVHDILTDLLNLNKEPIPFEEPKIGDWCYEATRMAGDGVDVRIGILKEGIANNQAITVTAGGREIYWTDAVFKKIPSDLMRATDQ